MNTVRISNVNLPVFNENKSKKEKNASRGPLITAGVGAVLGGGLELFNQSKVLKNPEDKAKYLEIQKNRILKIKNQNSRVRHERYFNQLKTIASEGKYNWKIIGVATAVNAAIFGGIHLICKGIASLFGKKDKVE